MNSGDILNGRYRVIGPLGYGGCASVFRARDIAEGVDVAIKVQWDQGFESTRRFDEYGERIHGEGDNLVLLSGIRGIPERRDADVFGPRSRSDDSGTRRYIVMDLFVGTTLDAYLDKPRTPKVQIAASVLGRLCEILGEVHDRGLVHRDIKPENVIVTEDGEVKLIDMGFAMMIGDKPDGPSGTLGFAAPEQYLSGTPATVACDMFSLGCVLGDILIRTLPYGGNARRVAAGTPPYTPDDLARIPPELREIALDMVAVEQGDRPVSTREVLRRLRPALPEPGSDRHPKIQSYDVTAWYREGRGHVVEAL